MSRLQPKPLHPSSRALIAERNESFASSFSSKWLRFFDTGTKASKADPDRIKLPKHQIGREEKERDLEFSWRLSKVVPSSSGLIGRFKPAPESAIGIPLILFDFNDMDVTYRKVPLLLTTKGVYADFIDSKVRHISWEEMDFVAQSDLIRDDATFCADRDDTVLKKCVRAKRFTWFAVLAWAILVPALFFLSHYTDNSVDYNGRRSFSEAIPILLGFGGVVSIVLAPLVILLIRYAMLLGVRSHIKQRFEANPSWQNILHINHYERVDIGVTPYAEGIIQCLKLALAIYRMQREKYGRITE